MYRAKSEGCNGFPKWYTTRVNGLGSSQGKVPHGVQENSEAQVITERGRGREGEVNLSGMLEVSAICRGGR